jgi:membrane associated rhomboid family serine protease
VFFMQHFRGEFLEYWLALWPNAKPISAWTGREVWELNRFYPWQLITYGFLHSTTAFTHILFNMFGLWMFGQSVEEELGSRRFLKYYLICVIGAGLVHVAYAVIVRSPVPVLGASGGVFGVLLAFGMLFPHARVMMLFFPAPIEARFLVLIYGGIELLNGVLRTNSGVAHFAHLGGMLFGFVLLVTWMRRDPRLGR